MNCKFLGVTFCCVFLLTQQGKPSPTMAAVTLPKKEFKYDKALNNEKHKKMLVCPTHKFSYSSAAHYWPLNQIGKKTKIAKDVCGMTNANVSEGVTTKYDDQLGQVVSLNAKDDSLVVNPFKSKCISDPDNCKLGITVEFWLKFRKGECILSTGGYTQRLVGPGFILKNNPKKRRLLLQLSTESKLWTLELNVRYSTWVHLMFTWKLGIGLVLYENGKFLTEAKTFQKVRYPSIVDDYRTLTVGAQQNYRNWKSGGVFEIGHLVIWTRRLSEKQIKRKAFLAVVGQSVRSFICCQRKQADPCIYDACYSKPRCDKIDEKYQCICPEIKEIKFCRNATSPVVSWSSAASDDDWETIIVASAVGVACVVMLLVIIAIVIARMNSKMQGEFIPDGTISPDNNTHEMIAAAVDPAPRITDVPYKSSKSKKTTKVMQLKQSDFMTSEI